MRTVMLAALAATTMMGAAATAEAQPIRTRVYPAPLGLSPDEVRDYQRDQLERRQEMDRERLRYNQKVERRMIDPDDDDDFD